MTNPLADTKGANLTVEQNKVICRGEWTLPHLTAVAEKISALGQKSITSIDGQAITTLDSAGAWMLCHLQQQLAAKNHKAAWENFNAEHQALLELIAAKFSKITPPIAPKKINPITQIGQVTVMHYLQMIEFITFWGETLVSFWRAFQVRRFQWRALLFVIEETGFQALAIVGLLSFLIGIVLAYQTAEQLKLYGANVYIVPILGIAVLQEFGPLITAIIVAGRTSSAFTAQIGTMKVNAEIDALQTMGFSPINWLVLPKIFGLLISLPLLFIWADIFGLLGGIIVSDHMLKIGFYGFVAQFTQVVDLSTFLNGLIKAPVFSLIIATVGCFHGFKVSSTADSVGRETTKSVVQAIFLIIIADAIFSIILPWQTI